MKLLAFSLLTLFLAGTLALDLTRAGSQDGAGKKKFKLNPNAKPFVPNGPSASGDDDDSGFKLNPNAKPFVPKGGDASAGDESADVEAEREMNGDETVHRVSQLSAKAKPFEPNNPQWLPRPAKDRRPNKHLWANSWTASLADEKGGIRTGDPSLKTDDQLKSDSRESLLEISMLTTTTPIATESGGNDDNSSDGSVDEVDSSTIVFPDGNASSSSAALLQLEAVLGESRKLRVHSISPDAFHAVSLLQSGLSEHIDHHVHPEGADLIHIDGSSLDGDEESVASFFDNARMVRNALHRDGVPVLIENNHLYPEEMAAITGNSRFVFGDHPLVLLDVDYHNEETRQTRYRMQSLLPRGLTMKSTADPELIMSALQTNAEADKSAGASSRRIPAPDIQELTVSFPSRYQVFDDVSDSDSKVTVGPREQGAATAISWTLTAAPNGEVAVKTEGHVTTGAGGVRGSKTKSGMYYDNPPPDGTATSPYNTIGYYTESADIVFAVDNPDVVARDKAPSAKETTWSVSLSSSSSWHADLGLEAGVDLEHMGPHAELSGEVGYRVTKGETVAQKLSDMDLVDRSANNGPNNGPRHKWTYNLRNLKDYADETAVASKPKAYTHWIDVVSPRQKRMGYVDTWNPQYTIPPSAANQFQPFAVCRFVLSSRDKRSLRDNKVCMKVIMEAHHTVRGISSMYGKPAFLLWGSGEWGYYVSKSYTNALLSNVDVCFGWNGSDYNPTLTETRFRNHVESTSPQALDSGGKSAKREPLGDEKRKLIWSGENLVGRRWKKNSGGSKTRIDTDDSDA